AGPCALSKRLRQCVLDWSELRFVEKRELAVFAEGKLPSPRRLAHLGWRGGIAAAEAAAEVGEIAQPRLAGDGGDGPESDQRIAEQATRLEEPLFEHEFRKGGALLPEQPLNVARRDALPPRDRADCQLRTREMLADVRFDGAEACGPRPATFGNM